MSEKFELKPCPFCGKTPKLEHEPVEKCRNSENGDLITKWQVKCPHCGIKVEGGITEYIFCNNEALKINNINFDGRSKAIEAWNRRANDGK